MSKRRTPRQTLCTALCAVACAIHAGQAGAQGTTANSWQIGFGNTGVLDTYLTQEKFSGNGLTVLAVSEYGRKDRGTAATAGDSGQKAWTTVAQHQVDASLTKDRGGHKSTIEGAYHLMVGRYRGWQLMGGDLRLQAGAAACADVGFIYNTRNSNNPAQARLNIMVMPSAIANYRFRFVKQQWMLRVETDLPLVGLAFSPNYGQSYYELFAQGNYDHNVVPTTMVAQPTFRQQVTLGWRMGSNTWLQVGWLGHFQQLSVNHLKQHVYTNRFMFGLAKGL